jgi:membrane-bound serine protease (ClpP class)
MIDEWQALFIERRLQLAQEENFDLVVLSIDTYGGSVQACERINRAIASCRVPVVAYVEHNAFSGGALLSLGCRAIVMAPGSLIGGAKAVTLFGDLPKDMREKVDSDMRAMVTNLCEANHHPTPIAVGMVNSDAEVIETDDPKNRFMMGNVFDELRVKPALVHKWKTKGQILTLTATEAVNVGLALGVADGHDELFLGLAVTPLSIEIADITVTEHVVRFLGHPAWRVLLVIIGLIGLVWELKAPGHGVGFIVFGFCMGVFFWLQIFCDNAGLLEVALFGAGAIFVAVELFFLPSFGALGFAGCAMVLVSIILAFLPKSVSLSHIFRGGGSIWEMQVINEGLKWAAITVVAVVGAIVTFLLRGASLPGLSRMALRAEVQGTAHAVDIPVAASMDMQAVADPLNELIGQTADVETVLRPAGKVRLGGITYDAVSEGGYIEPHTKVVILRAVSGNLVVRAV